MQIVSIHYRVLIDSSVNEDEDEVDKKKGLEGEVRIIRSSRSGSKKVRAETDLLSCMLKAHPIGREALLTHPVVQAFLYLKWMYVRKWFWFIRFFYVSHV